MTMVLAPESRLPYPTIYGHIDSRNNSIESPNTENPRIMSRESNPLLKRHEFRPFPDVGNPGRTITRDSTERPPAHKVSGGHQFVFSDGDFACAIRRQVHRIPRDYKDPIKKNHSELFVIDGADRFTLKCPSVDLGCRAFRAAIVNHILQRPQLDADDVFNWPSGGDHTKVYKLKL